MTVKEIVASWLKEHGYDGLCDSSYGECGCGIDNFMPCGNCNQEECIAAYKHKSKCDDCDNKCDYPDVDNLYCEQKRKEDSDHA